MNLLRPIPFEARLFERLKVTESIGVWTPCRHPKYCKPMTVNDGIGARRVTEGDNGPAKLRQASQVKVADQISSRVSVAEACLRMKLSLTSVKPRADYPGRQLPAPRQAKERPHHGARL
jgi:hypothetical protein